MKYGRQGSPHVRLVYLTDDLTKIAWCELKKGKRPDKDSFIRISDITDLRTVGGRLFDSKVCVVRAEGQMCLRSRSQQLLDTTQRSSRCCYC